MMKVMVRAVVAALLIGGCAVSVPAQDLYDTSVLRSFNLTFHDANWLTLLRNNWASETLILADLEVDGVVYPDVGVRIRGNTSYTGLPFGSEKFSLKIKMDHVHPDQELMSYDTINLNNGFRDPTFCREVAYNNYVARFIPNPRANHALVTLNGQNWGVYINVQQPDKRMLRDYFTNADGLRIRCANNLNGPGLQYVGANPASYSAYEIQNDGGLADPVGALIAVCNAVTNEPLPTWANIDDLFAIDPSIWSVVLENILTDDDSYVNKGCDFMTYRDPIDGRMHLLQRDANEAFTATTWAITRNFTASNKPVLSHVLAVPVLRQRYMAHYRTASEDMNWSYFGPIFDDLRARIDEHVQADPKKLYSYTLFVNNFTSTVNMPYAGLAGGSIIGLQQFVNQRASFLATSAELVASGPAIAWVGASSVSPDPTEDVYITAAVAPAGSPVAMVELFYRESADRVYRSVPMLDDGLSGDGAPGDGVYGALLPIVANGGQRVSFYVGAESANAYASSSFLPDLSERGPIIIEYGFGASGGIRITEWMYQGASGEFVELTNLSDGPIDMSGWSMDDDHAVPGAFDLSAFGVVGAGESVVISEALESAFREAWGIDPAVKIIGQLGAVTGNNLGRNDQIILFDAGGSIADRLDYGDQTYGGSIRTQGVSGQACADSLGQNDVYAWTLSVVGDQFGSYAASTGEIGTPGFYLSSACAECPADMNGDGVLDLADIQLFLVAFIASDPVADLNGDTVFDLADIQAFVVSFTSGCP